MISCNCTAAHKAILENDVDKLKFIICSGTDLSKECSCTKQISTLMHAAVYAGQSNIIELLSKNGVDKDATNAKGHTPLELAFILKNYDAAVRLVILGCDPNKHHYLRRTPLSIAISISHIKLVELLLLNKAEALPQEKVLYTAIGKGESKIVQILAKYYKSTINAIDDTGSIPLIYSVLNGSAEICKALLLAGCNVNATDKKKRTALIYAAQEGRSGHVQILVDHKADTSCVFDQRQKLTPLHIATIKGDTEVIRVLKPYEVHYDINGQTAFDLALKDKTLKLKKKRAILEAFVDFDFKHKIQGDILVLIAANIGHVDVLNILLKRGFNPNARDPSDKTPLYIATEKGHLKIIEALFNFGPAHSYSGSHDLQTKNTALHVAIAKKQDDKTIDLLLSNMAKEDMNKRSMESLLLLAIEIGNVRFIEKLLKKGDWYSGELDENPRDYNDIVEADKKFNINTRDSERKTPLFKATEIGHIQTVQALVQCGLRIRSARPYCRYSTALHVAIFKNYDESMISLLCEYAGEELNNQNDDGKTPLMIAIENENVPAVKVLMKNNADINIEDYFGYTPFSVVEKMENIELWSILLGINSDRKALVNLAITENMDNLLKILVHKGVAIDDEHVVTALNMHKDNKYLELLLSNNVHIQQNSKALSIAFSRNNERAVELLIGVGANCKYAYDTGNLYLIEAVEKDQHKIVEILLNSGCNPNWICNLAGENELETTPLKLAVESLNISMVELLLKKGAEPSSADLSRAIKFNSVDLVEILVDAGVAIGKDNLKQCNCYKRKHIYNFLLSKAPQYESNVIIPEPKPLIRIAKMKKTKSIGKLQFFSSSGFTDLHYAASLSVSKGGDKKIMLLIERGVDVNLLTKQTKFCAPLHIAVAHGLHNNVKLLINANANVNELNYKEETPLWISVEKGLHEITKTLLKAGASTDTKNAEGLTILEHHIEKNNVDKLKLLIECGAKLNSTGIKLQNIVEKLCGKKMLKILDDWYYENTGSGLLSLMIQNGFASEVWRFGHFGKYPHKYQNKHNGITPIHLVVDLDYKDFLKYFPYLEFLEMELDCFCWQNNETPLYRAIRKNREEAARYLVLSKADCSIGCFKTKKSSIELAIERNLIDLVELMIATGTPRPKTLQQPNVYNAKTLRYYSIITIRRIISQKSFKKKIHSLHKDTLLPLGLVNELMFKSSYNNPSYSYNP